MHEDSPDPAPAGKPDLPIPPENPEYEQQATSKPRGAAARREARISRARRRATRQLRRVAADLDPHERYTLAERVAGAVDPSYRFSEHGRLYLQDEAFQRYYERFMDAGNWHSLDRKYFLDQLLPLATQAEGDLVECGTWNGASAWLMCRHGNSAGRHVHIFDSFEGLSAPTEADGDYWEGGDLECGEDVVHRNLAEFKGAFTTYAGWIPDRFADVAERRFCFVHVDVDLYEPTRDSIRWFWPRLSPGGIILLDDHGFASCPGARKAALEYFNAEGVPVVDVPTGQGFVQKR